MAACCGRTLCGDLDICCSRPRKDHDLLGDALLCGRECSGCGGAADAGGACVAPFAAAGGGWAPGSCMVTVQPLSCTAAGGDGEAPAACHSVKTSTNCPLCRAQPSLAQVAKLKGGVPPWQTNASGRATGQASRLDGGEQRSEPLDYRTVLRRRCALLLRLHPEVVPRLPVADTSPCVSGTTPGQHRLVVRS